MFHKLAELQNGDSDERQHDEDHPSDVRVIVWPYSSAFGCIPVRAVWIRVLAAHAGAVVKHRVARILPGAGLVFVVVLMYVQIVVHSTLFGGPKAMGVDSHFISNHYLFLCAIGAQIFLDALSVVGTADTHVLERAIRARVDALSGIVILLVGNKLRGPVARGAHLHFTVSFVESAAAAIRAAARLFIPVLAKSGAGGLADEQRANVGLEHKSA